MLSLYSFYRRRNYCQEMECSKHPCVSEPAGVHSGEKLAHPVEKLPHSGAPGKIPENSQSGEKFRLTPVEKLKNWLTPVFQGIFPEN